MIASMFPGVALLEMFARRFRTGWTSHGDGLPTGVSEPDGREAFPDVEAMAKRPPNRWDCPSIHVIGDEVIDDAEGEYLGLQLKTTVPARAV
jgi:hypothetical protein